MPSYTNEQKAKALHLLDDLKSPKKVVDILGYPEKRDTLYNWMKQRDKYIPPDTESTETSIFQVRARNVSQEAILGCLLDGMSVKLTAETLNYSPETIYKWRKIFLDQGYKINMSRAKYTKDSKTPSQKELDEMRAQMHEMQLEIDILRETINVLKKDPGIDLTALSNSEKAVIVDVLRNKYSLPKLLKRMQLPRSSYYYKEQKKQEHDKYEALTLRIKELFFENKCRYGYRRIHCLLKRENITVSEKIVRRIMRVEKLIVKAKKKRKYTSYQGEITPAVPNHLQRDFHAEEPNQKWLTDITEFSIPAGKIYLSPIIDCYDGLPVCWKIGESPNAELVNSMLDDAVKILSTDEKPIIHSDRGCHYRWPGWIERMDKFGLIRSMSKKGCSPDNSACEGFFGILKNEMFYERNWENISLNDFKVEIETYINWFRNERIKMSLGGLSPLDYRRSKGYAV